MGSFGRRAQMWLLVAVLLSLARVGVAAGHEDEANPPPKRCTWLRKDDGICVDITSKEHLCGGTIRFPEPKQASKGIKTYCKNADGSRMDFKWQCCQGSVAMSSQMPDLTSEEKGWHAKLLAGEYADSAKYDMQKGEFTHPAELQALFAKYAAKDGLTTTELNKCDGKESIGGDEMTCVDDLYPMWVHQYRLGLSSEMAPKKQWDWPEPNQAKSRLAEAFWLSFFVSKCGDIGSVDRVPVNVRFFLKNLFKSNNNRQSAVVGGCGTDQHAYCAAASSKAMIYGFADWGYTVPSAGWTWYPNKFSHWMPGKLRVSPGDVIQYQSFRSPCSGHVATVVCADASAPGTGQYESSTIWVVSGNTGPGGTVAVDRIKGVPVPSTFELHSTWNAYAESELAKEDQNNPELLVSSQPTASKGKSASADWKAKVERKAAEIKAARGPKDGEAFIYSVASVSQVQPWILDQVQKSGELISRFKIRRSDEVAYAERMESQGVHVTVAPAPHSVLLKRGGYGACSVSGEPGVCLKRAECPTERFYATPKNADPLCPDAPVGAGVGCCLPSGVSCGGGTGECYSPGYLPPSEAKTFCTGFSFDAVECKNAAARSKCCVPAPPADQLDAELKAPVNPFLAGAALAAINVADPKPCSLKSGAAGFCLPVGAKPLLCPGKLEFPSKGHATGCDKNQWCCGTAGPCDVAGQTGECVSKKVASSCPQPFGAQPSSKCSQDYLCCVPDTQTRKKANAVSSSF